VECGVWSVECGVWSVECIVYSVECRERWGRGLRLVFAVHDSKDHEGVEGVGECGAMHLGSASSSIMCALGGVLFLITMQHANPPSLSQK